MFKHMYFEYTKTHLKYDTYSSNKLKSVLSSTKRSYTFSFTFYVLYLNEVNVKLN